MNNALRKTAAVQQPVPAREEPAAAPSDEIDLLAYAETCWRYRYVLLGVVLAAAIGTYAYNRQIAPTYEVAFRLMVTEPDLGNDPRPRATIVPFRELVQSPSQAAAVLNELNLTGPPHNLTPGKFLKDHVSVDVGRDSPIIRVAVRLQDRELLVKVAARFADRIVSTAQRLSSEEGDYTAQRIKQQRDSALDRLTGVERALRDYQRRVQIELLRKDVDTLLERRPEELDLSVQIQAERARVRQVEAELARQDKVRQVRRATESLPAAVDSAPMARSTQNSGGSDDLKIRGELLDPYVNPVYEALERDAALARTKLAGLEQQRKELVDRLQLNARSAEKLNRLYEAEATFDALTRDQDVARAAYMDAATKYEEARLQSTFRSPRLQILDAPLRPEAPVAPRPLRNTLVVMLIALTVTVVGVLVYDGWRAPAIQRG